MALSTAAKSIKSRSTVVTGTISQRYGGGSSSSGLGSSSSAVQVATPIKITFTDVSGKNVTVALNGKSKEETIDTHNKQVQQTLVSQAKEAEKIKELQVSKIQRQKAASKIGVITSKEVTSSGEVIYKGLDGKKYSFPSKSELTYNPDYRKEIRGGSGVAEIKEKISRTSFYNSNEDRAKEEALQLGRDIQSSLQERILENKVSKRTPLTSKEFTQYNQIMAAKRIEHISGLMNTKVSRDRRDYLVISKGDKTLTVTPSLATLTEKGKQSAIFYPEYLYEVPKQQFTMKDYYRPNKKDYSNMTPEQIYRNALTDPYTWIETFEQSKKTLAPLGTVVKTTGQVFAGYGNIIPQTFRDIEKTKLGQTKEYKSFIAGAKNNLFIYPIKQFGNVIEDVSKSLPSSVPLRNYFVEPSLQDIKIYKKSGNKFKKLLAETNILSTDILLGAYETIRQNPKELYYETIKAYVVGGVFGSLSRAPKLATPLKVAGGTGAGLYVGSVGYTAYSLPLEEKGKFLGRELTKSGAFVLGFSAGYKDFYKTPLRERLISKEGLTYQGDIYTEIELSAIKKGIISEKAGKLKESPYEISGIITGKPNKKISISGSVLGDINKGIIYENRFVEYKGSLFRSNYLVKEKYVSKSEKSFIDLFSYNKNTGKIKNLFSTTRKVNFLEYYSPIVKGFERIDTRQTKSSTPKRAFELYYTSNGKLSSKKILTGQSKEELKRLKILQKQLTGIYEISPNVISQVRTEADITLTAKQTRPQKNILYVLEKDLMSRTIKKYPIKEESSFRELYFGKEKFESRKAQYQQALYPKEVIFQELLLDNTAGRLLSNRLGKVSRVQVVPTKYVGLEEQYVPALIKKQQKMIFSQKFKFTIPTAEEKLFIQSVLGSKITEREKEQRLFTEFLKGETVSKELYKQLYRERVPIVNKKGKAFTPNYLKKLNEEFRINNAVNRLLEENTLASDWYYAKSTITKKYPLLAEELKLDSASLANKNMFTKLVENEVKFLRTGIRSKPKQYKSKEVISYYKPKMFLEQKGNIGNNFVYDNQEIYNQKAINEFNKQLNINIIKPKINTKAYSNFIKEVSNVRIAKSYNIIAPIYLSKLKLENKLENSLRNELKSNFELNIKTNSKLNLKNNLKLNNMLRNDIKTNLRANLKNSLKTELNTDLNLYSNLQLNLIVNVPNIDFVPPIISPPPPIEEIDFFKLYAYKGKKKKYAKTKLDKRFKYLPSLTAVSKNIKGKKPRLISGLTIRPIITTR